jgi:hypothetical protein
MTGLARPEIMKHAVSVRLQHSSMDVETRVAQLGNLFGQEFNTGRRVTKDDGLIDLEL